jgi:hypothetical protein
MKPCSYPFRRRKRNFKIFLLSNAVDGAEAVRSYVFRDFEIPLCATRGQDPPAVALPEEVLLLNLRGSMYVCSAKLFLFSLDILPDACAVMKSHVY